MFMAVAAKAETRGRGVMETNSHCDVGAFLSQHVLPELTKDPNADGLTKSACLRCVIKFRNQLPKEALLKVPCGHPPTPLHAPSPRSLPFPLSRAQVLELMMAMLRSTHTVVRTLAAITLERILVVKDAPPQGAAGARPQPRIGREDLRRCLGTVLPLLFQMVSGADAENEHVMRAIMRVVCNGQEDVAPFIGDVLSHLTVVLERVCGQPSNPQFTHFLFETLAVLIRNACSASSGNVASFERTLFPPFQAVLQRQVSEVTPYVFQVRVGHAGLPGSAFWPSVIPHTHHPPPCPSCARSSPSCSSSAPLACPSRTRRCSRRCCTRRSGRTEATFPPSSAS